MVTALRGIDTLQKMTEQGHPVLRDALLPTWSSLLLPASLEDVQGESASDRSIRFTTHTEAVAEEKRWDEAVVKVREGKRTALENERNRFIEWKKHRLSDSLAVTTCIPLEVLPDDVASIPHPGASDGTTHGRFRGDDGWSGNARVNKAGESARATTAQCADDRPPRYEDLPLCWLGDRKQTSDASPDTRPRTMMRTSTRRQAQLRARALMTILHRSDLADRSQKRAHELFSLVRRVPV